MKLPYQAAVRVPVVVELIWKKLLSSAISEAALPARAVPVSIAVAAGNCVRGVTKLAGALAVGGRGRRVAGRVGRAHAVVDPRALRESGERGRCAR